MSSEGEPAFREKESKDDKNGFERTQTLDEVFYNFSQSCSAVSNVLPLKCVSKLENGWHSPTCLKPMRFPDQYFRNWASSLWNSEGQIQSTFKYTDDHFQCCHVLKSRKTGLKWIRIEIKITNVRGTMPEVPKQQQTTNPSRTKICTVLIVL